MKRTKRSVSLFLAIILIAIYILPSTGILRAASLSDFTKVTVFANSNFPVSTDLSQGVQFTTGSEYLTVTTTDATDPYFTVDMTDTSLKGKFIAIKFKATAETKIANGYHYPETSAGNWGPTGGGLLDSSKMVCDGSWNIATYDISQQLLSGSGVGSATQTSATLYSLRIAAVAKVGATLQIAYVGVFDSASQIEKYDELYCSTYTSVKIDKPTIIPNAKYSISAENYDFQEAAVTNGLKLIGSNTNVNTDWVYKEGANLSAFVVDGTNKYLKLQFDSFAHGELYANNVPYYFSADVKPGDKANHFAGFVFNYAQENAWKENMFYESNGTDGENCVSKSGIGVNIFPNMIIVYVVCYDRDTASLKRIEYRHLLSKNIGDSFHNFKAIDNADGTIRFLLDNELIAYVEYSNPGSMPASAKNHFEYYYRTAKIFNPDGEMEASASDALIAYIKSLAAGSRARVIYLDNLKFASLGSVAPSIKLDKTTVDETVNINALVNYGDYLVNDLYLGIYNEGEECGGGIGKVSPSYKIELDKQRTVKLPKLMAGNYYAVLMSGTTMCSSKVSFKVTDVEQNESIFIRDLEAKVGTTVRVPVVLNSNPGIKDLTIKISCNSNGLIPVNASNGIVMSSASFKATKTDSYYILSWSNTANTTSKGTLAYVEFEVHSAAPLGENSINIDVVNASSKNGNITSSVTAGKGAVKVKDTSLKANSMTLSISNDISLMYLVNKNDFDNAGYSDPYIIAELNQRKEKLVPSVTTVNGKLCYVFTFYNISPQLMKDNVKSTLYAMKGQECISSTAFSSSICDYLYRSLELTEDLKFKTLIVDMLNYGEAAQKYTEYNINDLANSELTEKQKMWGTNALRDLTNVISVTNAKDTDKAKWSNLGLILKNNISISGSFTTNSINGVYVKITDKDNKVIKNITSDNFTYENNKYSFVFNDLYATQLSDVFYFTIYDSNNKAISGTCLFSVESYVAYSQNQNDNKLKTITQMIIKYGDSAKSYVQGHSTPFTKLEPIYIGTSFYANIAYQGKYIYATGSNVDLRSPDSSANQFWKFNYQDDGSYEIISLYDGKALDVDNALDQDFANVQTYTANDTMAQRWYIYLIDGQYVFRSAISENRVLDIYSASIVDGTNVDIYQYNDTPAQKFNILNMTGDAVMYFVTSPYNEASSRIATTTTLSAAEEIARNNSHYGYVVYTSLGKLVYVPTPSLNSAKILWNAKKNLDYARTHGYIYGDASVNPALDKSERVVSCDRFVGWTLYDAGFNRNGQPSTKGYTLYTTNNLEQLLISLGFTKITNMSLVAGGDVIFVGDSHSLAVPSNYKDYPRHVFIAAGFHSGSNYYRYDAGTDGRLQSVQPSIEPLSYPDMRFRFAYRAPAN